MRKNTMSTSPKRVYDSARYAILFLVILSVINILVISTDYYFVSSVFASFFLAAILGGWGGALVGVLVLIPLILAFLLSRKNPVWLIVALVVVILDTLFLIGIGLLLGILATRILDLLAHGFVIVALILGIKKGKEAVAAPYAAYQLPSNGWNAAPQQANAPSAPQQPAQDPWNAPQQSADAWNAEEARQAALNAENQEENDG